MGNIGGEGENCDTVCCFRHIGLLGDLLLSSDMELRIAAGEAIALLYDLNRCYDEVSRVSLDTWNAVSFLET